MRRFSPVTYRGLVRPSAVAAAVDSAFGLVAVGRPVRGEFTYSVPEALRGRLLPGQRLRIPFGNGNGTALGFFLAATEAPAQELLSKIKPIERLLDEVPALSEDVVALVRFAAAHYRYPLGEALRAALPPGLSQAEDSRPPSQHVLRFAVAAPSAALELLTRAPAQHAALSYLLAVGGRADVEEIARAIPGARETLRKLEARGFISFETQDIIDEVEQGLEQVRPKALTAEQEVAVSALTHALDEGGFSPWLLHGVTGSGKTEVYLRLVEHALVRERGALILVPEIALTPQLVGRFRSRFGQAVAVLHSALRDKERLRSWQALRSGEVRIAVGVRSAIFAPVADLGVVVVDEEHDPSFKQEEKLRYQARDLAVVRAKHANALVVLGSATPSLETLENVRRGRYRQLQLHRRVDDRPMPEVALVDLRTERPRHREGPPEEPPVLSSPVRDAIAQTLARGQQVILFLNRRGHSTLLVCEVCGGSLKCSDCDVCLTHHLSSRRLQCHYCGRAQPLPEQCPECAGPLLELGIGTERVEAEVAEAFPKARVARLDRDAASSAERLTQLLASFARREIDILVGTQMVAKGHDFPGVTLVCVVLADSALALPDFRASERTFHLLTQVAGRAGRGRDAGRVLVQSYNPLAPPIAAMLRGDFAGFSQEELRRRQLLNWPPFSRMAVVRIEGADPERTADVARRLSRAVARRLPAPEMGVRLLGPAPAPVSRIKGKTRWQLVVKGPTHAAVAGPLDEVERLLPEVPYGVTVVIDVDPAAML